MNGTGTVRLKMKVRDSALLSTAKSQYDGLHVEITETDAGFGVDLENRCLQGGVRPHRCNENPVVATENLRVAHPPQPTSDRMVVHVEIGGDLIAIPITRCASLSV
jgi:hypothetical protein